MATPQPKTSVASLSNPVKSGFLTKQGGSIKTWKKRWFVLKGQTLWYFKTDKDQEQKGFILLESNSVCQLEPSKSKKNSHFFSVSTSKRVFLIYSDTEKESKEWVEVIKKQINEKKGGGASTGGGSSGSSNASTGGSSQSLSPASTPSNTSTPTPTPAPAPTPTPAPTPAPAPAPTPANTNSAPPKEDKNSRQVSPRDIIMLAKGVVPFLQDDESKVLEFWQLWLESIPPSEDLMPGMEIDFHVSTSANMQKLTWRTAGAQNIFIQKMVDFFWNVGAPESEIDRLNDVGTLINPITIGSWIDMSAKGGMDGGWYFPVQISLKTALEAADPGEAAEKVGIWGEKHSVESCFSVGRDMGAAPPRQTELRVEIPGNSFSTQIAIAKDAFAMFGFPEIPAEAQAVLDETQVPGICMSVVTSSEGFVRLGLLSPKPQIDAVIKLCQVVGAKNEDLAQFEGSLGTDGPQYVEYQFLKEGFGYGVYKEGFDIVFHYFVGKELGDV